VDPIGYDSLTIDSDVVCNGRGLMACPGMSYGIPPPLAPLIGVHRLEWHTEHFVCDAAARRMPALVASFIVFLVHEKAKITIRLETPAAALAALPMCRARTPDPRSYPGIRYSYRNRQRADVDPHGSHDDVGLRPVRHFRKAAHLYPFGP
jgi:hypothetical protein